VWQVMPISHICHDLALQISRVAGYHAAMDALRRTDTERIAILETHLHQLIRQRREAWRQLEYATGYVRGLDRQITVIETDLELARAGQLSFDLRVEPEG
jgi:hypothetical protein